MRAIEKSIFATTNRLLAALSSAELGRLAPHLRRVQFKNNEVLYDVGDEVTTAYFIESGIISLISITEDDESIEAGLVGYEGMIGTPAILRYHRAPFRAMAQISGEALSLNALILREEFKRGGDLQEVILCFTHTLVSQFAQLLACNRFHTVERRLARWLLMTRDRIQADEFNLTHEFLAYMLGTSRPDVTKAAGKMQEAGLIRYKRGVITILDAKRLEKAACACYRTMRKETEMFLAA